MRYVNRRGTHVLKLLLKLEESVLDLLFDVLGQVFLGADQFGVLGVAPLLHDTAPVAHARLLELVYAAVGHGHLLVLLDLLGRLRGDTVHG